MPHLIHDEPTEIVRDVCGSRLTVGPSIPDGGHRLTTTTINGVSAIVDLDAAAVARLVDALRSPLPLVDADTGEPW